ncbi:rRNA-binding ribosome biosynthesis protein utp25 [Orbilia blumenaviensis]|uniref:U3 small nucleolar RNA-associated protein 25 n=1 Tax=Orbilia blumenaviensis TaxID=1796055 RepID=A0AAV9U8S9_9PEZI
MTFSALLDSFNDTKRKSSKPPHSQEPSQKRRKLHAANLEITDQTTTDGKSSTSFEVTPLGSNITNAALYKAHFDIEEAPECIPDPSTVLHPVLGRVTVSNIQLLSEYPPNNPGRPSGETPSYRSQLSQYVSNYTDTTLASTSGADRDAFRKLVCSHGLAHVLTTRQTVLKNSAKLSKQSTNNNEAKIGRDQGFTRPKVLFVLPTRNSCYDVINHIIALAHGHECENRQRFNKEYGPGAEKSFPDTKPEDFKRFFHGNSDDMFRIGVKLTRKTIKLFSKFYHSDIILASPLGLKSVISTAAKGGGDADFLSSIEILYLDSADALQMQNWDHVESILASINQMPKDAHDCDFSRVRNWYLNGAASAFRQTIVSTNFLFPEANSLLSKFGRNYAGLIKFHNVHTGELSPYIPQIFTRVKSANPAHDPDARFEYFTKNIMPFWKSSGTVDRGGLLIFLSSYLDSIRLRNYFNKIGQSFGEINEYTSASEVTRSRAHFSSGRQKILIYTERAHYFRRYNLKGVCNVFLYSMPANAIFYREIVGFLRESISEGKSQLEESKVRAVFTPWDALRVERIVGSSGYEEMKGNNAEGVDFEFP